MPLDLLLHDRDRNGPVLGRVHRRHRLVTGFHERLASLPEPRRGLNWLRDNPTAGEYPRGLARGKIP